MRRNSGLYRGNPGIVDIIARCLRYQQADRPPNTDSVLRDIETFGNHVNAESPSSIGEALEKLDKKLDKEGNELYSWMARLQIRSLRSKIEDMTRGVYDLVGSHEDIVSGMTEYLSVLQTGDEYLTVSVPSFWTRRNLGTNGRFLSMNVIAARRGAAIHRVFLITHQESSTADVKEIIRAHGQMQHELRPATSPDSELAVETRFEIVERKQLDEFALEGKHNYGLLLKRGDRNRGLLIVPVYRTDGAIAMIQFRSDEILVSAFYEDFQSRLASSRPLTEWLA